MSVVNDRSIDFAFDIGHDTAAHFNFPNDILIYR